jgi:hypothetical protein
MIRQLLGRIAVEKRAIVLPLALLLLANFAAYFLVVRPLAGRANNVNDRAAVAARAARAAEREYEAAQALVSGKAQADEELTTFYQKVLPANLSAARRMTYAALPALASKTHVRYEERTNEVEEPKQDARLGHLTIHMVLQGDYESLRTFIYELETAPEFVIIDDVTLTESTADESLTLTVNLSTYFLGHPNGA